MFVLDTSVLVAAWRSNAGASFELVSAVLEGGFEVAISVPLILEYESALVRNCSRGQRASDVTDLLDRLCAVAQAQVVYFLWRPLLSDPNDDMVVEVAVASGSDTIVTHNLRDFREAKSLGLRVLAPGPFIRHILET